ncbi:MAG: methylmalonyl-CoA mutase [Candidatus Rokubacteria bacterium RIFCSPLOWO2_02_FULL_68_19]|nr:MAG: methylmalonyl-CoA mutase [Candidatus Rokubacteria bacterium RIFCSPLOWO2_02_FULL_68_19]
MPAEGAPEYLDMLGFPGDFPMTRGIYPGMFRERLWTIRQYSGFGTPEETNARYRFLLAHGQTGLSVAFDLPTQMGLDSDDPRAYGEVGKVGVAIDTVDDLAAVFEGIPLEKISVSFTINATAAIILAMYVVVAQERGIGPELVTGTIQNDILKEYVARGTWIFPVEPALRMIVDTIDYTSRELPRFNPISIAGAHFKDAGATAVQEAAFTLADAIAYVEYVTGRGLPVDAFAPRLSFYFYTHSDLFEEVAKYRAMRRLWARVMRDRFGAKDPRSWHFRFGVVCGGSTLTRQEPLNNVVRVAYQALASVLGGAQTIFTCAWDEAIAIPTEASALLALRTQQILGYETNVPAVVDPLGGSYFLEDLTARMEAAVAEKIAQIERDGGMVAAVEAGRVQQEIADSAYRWQQAVEHGERRIVGVNWDRTEEAPVGELFREHPQTVSHQLARLTRVKAARDGARVEKALAALNEAAAGDENLMPYFLEAAAARASIGEMVTRLRKVFGEFREPLVF